MNQVSEEDAGFQVFVAFWQFWCTWLSTLVSRHVKGSRVDEAWKDSLSSLAGISPLQTNSYAHAKDEGRSVNRKGQNSSYWGVSNF